VNDKEEWNCIVSGLSQNRSDLACLRLTGEHFAKHFCPAAIRPLRLLASRLNIHSAHQQCPFPSAKTASSTSLTHLSLRKLTISSVSARASRTVSSHFLLKFVVFSPFLDVARFQSLSDDIITATAGLAAELTDERNRAVGLRMQLERASKRASDDRAALAARLAELAAASQAVDAEKADVLAAIAQRRRTLELLTQ
jgi:hypothetical protein